MVSLNIAKCVSTRPKQSRSHHVHGSTVLSLLCFSPRFSSLPAMVEFRRFVANSAPLKDAKPTEATLNSGRWWWWRSSSPWASAKLNKQPTGACGIRGASEHGRWGISWARTASSRPTRSQRLGEPWTADQPAGRPVGVDERSSRQPAG